MTAFGATQRTLADAVVSDRAANRLAADVLLIALFSAVVAASAQIAIPLPFTPVPITGQTLGVLLTGVVLGHRRGALALALYLLEGCAGLPVFAGGATGAHHLFGPTGGYLISYPLAAGVVGFLAERGWDRKPLNTISAMAIGNLIIYALGVGWVAFFVHGLRMAVVQGMLPFLPGDAIKIALAAALMPAAWGIVGRRETRLTPRS
jgi:biotin transport system substrate-specific component